MVAARNNFLNEHPILYFCHSEERKRRRISLQGMRRFLATLGMTGWAPVIPNPPQADEESPCFTRDSSFRWRSFGMTGSF